jgi:hypothetical protein
MSMTRVREVVGVISSIQKYLKSHTLHLGPRLPKTYSMAFFKEGKNYNGILQNR